MAGVGSASGGLAGVVSLGLLFVGTGDRGSHGGHRHARMVISEATVKTHLLHIYAKLGVNDRAAAVAAAFERGLIKPPATDKDHQTDQE